jgi:hypothetical protein
LLAGNAASVANGLLGDVDSTRERRVGEQALTAGSVRFGEIAAERDQIMRRSIWLL